ncbi:hypothetical protein Rhal01_02289 [Rubritalea halochordaticola]|uniref:Cadherin domain-containing protein n=1 Tax=Rubritalea halochordaticola TaxID=714537 RepID=A0ABP9V0R7_9BACT
MNNNPARGAWRYLCVLLVFATTVFAFLTGGRKDEKASDVDTGDAHSKKLTSQETDSVHTVVPGSQASTEKPVGQVKVLANNAAHKGACGCASCASAPAQASEIAKTQPEKAVPVNKEFISKVLKAEKGSPVSFDLPGGSVAKGQVDYSRVENGEVMLAQGKLIAPQSGFFFFQKQSMDGVAGKMVGVVRFDAGELAYSVTEGADGEPVLVEQEVDAVICRNYAKDAPADEAVVLEGPEDYPEDPSIPAYQNGVPRYESMPGATAVLYLDFDGQEGQVEGWSVVDALPSGLTPKQIRETWEHVAEDFAPFTINVTTDKAVYDAAPENSRQRCLISPSSPVGSGVAYLNSFNWTGDTPCWAGYRGSKVGHEVTSHEFGHTLRLSHDGRTEPSEGYFGGYGSGETGWAPIMGNSYYKELTQWSKGEYTNANQLQDDLAIITNDNNNVDYKVDDHGDSIGAASPLAIAGDGTVTDEGIIATSADADVFSFTTASAGPLHLAVNPGVHDSNLDVLLELLDSSGNVITSSNPSVDTDATIYQASLAAGTYYLRIDGVGKGDPAWGGYSDYCSLGHYKVRGNVGNAQVPLVYWALDDETGTTAGDSSSRQNDGLLSGGTSWTVASKDGGGASFDGVDDRITWTMTESNLGAFTVAFWAKNGASGQPVYDSVFCNRTPNTGNTFQIDMGNGFQYRGSATASFGSSPVGTWVHLAVVSDGVDTKLYYNGVLTQTLTGVNDDLFNSVNLGVNRNEGNFFQGQVDEFYLFDSALSQQDLLDLSGISLNVAPTVSNATFAVNENDSVGIVVGTVTANDANAGDVITYSIISGNHGGEFAIDANTGEITATVSLDREAVASYPLIVRATDSGGLSNTAYITVDVVDVPNDDSDGDGLTDEWELQYFGSTVTQDGNDDSDGDGLSNDTELTIGTNPANVDTDGDGFSDNVEFLNGTDPNDAQDYPNQTLIVLWSLDDGSGTTAIDASGLLNDGQLSGGTSWTSNAVEGGGASFDGVDDRITLDMTESNLGAFTVAFWVKNGASGQSIYSSAFCNHTPNVANTFQIDMGNGYQYRGSATASFGSAPVGQWVHLAVVSDGADTTLYYNGSAGQTLTGVNDDLFDSVNLGVNRNVGDFFQGEIDELYLYKEALSGSEVAALANQAPATVSYTSISESTAVGSISSGNYTDTATSNNVREVLQEYVTGGKPSNRVSSLEHTWTFDIGSGGTLVELSVEAHHSANSEGDDFIFAYSTDGANFTDLITVSKTSDDDVAQLAPLPAGVTGTVYIRVRDADQSAGNNAQDSLSVDQLSLEVTE